MRKLVFLAIMKVAGKVGAHIRTGRTGVNLLGAFTGAAAGTLAGFIVWQLGVVGAIFGAVAGASITAAIWKAPPSTEAELPGLPKDPGDVRHVVAFEAGGITYCTVLMDRVLYACMAENVNSAAIVQSLRHGQDPGLYGRCCLPLDALESFELEARRKGNPLVTGVSFRWRGALRGGVLFSHTAAEVESIIGQIEQMLGRRFERGERPVGTRTAVGVPSILIALVIVVTFGTAALAAYWQVSPPRSYRPAGPVGMLMRFGPVNTALVGMTIATLPAAWLVRRIYVRPRVPVFGLRR